MASKTIRTVPPERERELHALMLPNGHYFTARGAVIIGTEDELLRYAGGRSALSRMVEASGQDQSFLPTDQIRAGFTCGTDLAPIPPEGTPLISVQRWSDGRMTPGGERAKAELSRARKERRI